MLWWWDGRTCPSAGRERVLARISGCEIRARVMAMYGADVLSDLARRYCGSGGHPLPDCCAHSTNDVTTYPVPIADLRDVRLVGVFFYYTRRVITRPRADHHRSRSGLGQGRYGLRLVGNSLRPARARWQHIQWIRSASNTAILYHTMTTDARLRSSGNAKIIVKSRYKRLGVHRAWLPVHHRQRPADMAGSVGGTSHVWSGGRAVSRSVAGIVIGKGTARGDAFIPA